MYSFKRNQQGVASVPVIIWVLTAVVFVGIVFAAMQADRRRGSINPDLERAIQENQGQIPPVDIEQAEVPGAEVQLEPGDSEAGEGVVVQELPEGGAPESSPFELE